MSADIPTLPIPKLVKYEDGNKLFPVLSLLPPGLTAKNDTFKITSVWGMDLVLYNLTKARLFPQQLCLSCAVVINHGGASRSPALRLPGSFVWVLKLQLRYGFVLQIVCLVVVCFKFGLNKWKYFLGAIGWIVLFAFVSQTRWEMCRLPARPSVHIEPPTQQTDHPVWLGPRSLLVASAPEVAPSWAVCACSFPHQRPDARLAMFAQAPSLVVEQPGF